MKNTIKTLDPNTQGRDFVIGDLHGSLSALVNLLHNLNFDYAVDRLISVGDLVDRGPDSMGCLRLLNEPWFHAVLANHEQMMLEAFNGGYMGNFWIQNGGGWGLNAWEDWNALQNTKMGHPSDRLISAESLELFELLVKVDEMPFLITINRPDGTKFHVLHAELSPGEMNLSDADLSSPARVQELATRQAGDGDAFLWSRYLFGQFSRRDLSNTNKIARTVQLKYNGGTGPFNDKLSHIISGHSVVRCPLTIFGQTNIDTCAYASYDDQPAKYEALTCVELGTWKFYQATEVWFKEVLPLVINKESLLKLLPEATP